MYPNFSLLKVLSPSIIYFLLCVRLIKCFWSFFELTIFFGLLVVNYNQRERERKKAIFVPNKLGCRHSSPDLSVPSILLPQVRVPSTPSLLLSFKVFVLFFCHVKRTKINKKRMGLAHLKKETRRSAHSWNVTNVISFVVVVLCTTTWRQILYTKHDDDDVGGKERDFLTGF